MIINIRHRPLLNRPQLRNDFYIVHAGCSASDQIKKQQYDVYAFGLIIDGKGRYRMPNRKWREMQTGDLLFVEPDTTYEYGPLPNENWQVLYIAFHGASARQRFNAMGMQQWTLTLKHWQQLIHDWEAIIDLIENEQPRTADLAIAKAEQLITDIYHRRADLAGNQEHEQKQHEVIHWLQKHAHQDIVLEDVAEQFNMSYALFRLRVRQLTGYPPGRFLCRLRCQQASRLLVETELPIKTITQQIGMEDQYSFSRSFKREMGQSPLYYRKQFQG